MDTSWEINNKHNKQGEDSPRLQETPQMKVVKMLNEKDILSNKSTIIEDVYRIGIITRTLYTYAMEKENTSRVVIIGEEEYNKRKLKENNILETKVIRMIRRPNTERRPTIPI